MFFGVLAELIYIFEKHTIFFIIMEKYGNYTLLTCDGKQVFKINEFWKTIIVQIKAAMPHN